MVCDHWLCCSTGKLHHTNHCSLDLKDQSHTQRSHLQLANHPEWFDSHVSLKVLFYLTIQDTLILTSDLLNRRLISSLTKVRYDIAPMLVIQNPSPAHHCYLLFSFTSTREISGHVSFALQIRWNGIIYVFKLLFTIFLQGHSLSALSTTAEKPPDHKISTDECNTGCGGNHIEYLVRLFWVTPDRNTNIFFPSHQSFTANTLDPRRTLYMLVWEDSLFKSTFWRICPLC